MDGEVCDGATLLACGKGWPFGEESGEEQDVGRGKGRPRILDATLGTRASRMASSGASAASCDSTKRYGDYAYEQRGEYRAG